MSERQAEANRRNAQQSTGPRTDKGKAVSARNATLHGLLARVPVLPDEATDAFAAFEARLVTHLGPVGELEELLVDRVVLTAWRLQRVGRIEAGLLTTHYFAAQAARAQAVADRYEEADFESPFGETVTNTRRRAAALKQVEAAQAAGDARTDTALGLAFLRDHEADAFTKLSRYEGALERSLYRALHELQRFQAVRAGNPVPPPVAVDVTLAHES